VAAFPASSSDEVSDSSLVAVVLSSGLWTLAILLLPAGAVRPFPRRRPRGVVFPFLRRLNPLVEFPTALTVVGPINPASRAFCIPGQFRMKWPAWPHPWHFLVSVTVTTRLVSVGWI